jgi:elongator complex protein 3
MKKRGLVCQCIRCREVRGQETVNADDVTLVMDTYETDATEERFLQYLTPSGRLAGLLRLSMPSSPRTELPISEIRETAMVRELHVYGPAQHLGRRQRGVQHRGLGTQLLEEAVRLAKDAGFRRLAVIAAAGTRLYYRERGFTEGHLYPTRLL